MNKKSVSVVTTTWNERENIEKLILSVRTVLEGTPHEIIVVDDDSPDGTAHIAKRYADTVISKKREGQTKGLLYGMQLAKYPVIVTLDADLENDPKIILDLVKQTSENHLIMASRTKIPRISEKIASKTLGKIIGITDIFSNFRAIRKEIVTLFELKAGETFGAEFQIIAKKKSLNICEIKYDPPQRRKNPRIGGTFIANLRILRALLKSLVRFLK